MAKIARLIKRQLKHVVKLHQELKTKIGKCQEK